MELVTNYLLFFFVGLFQDILITYYYQVIAKERAVRAAAASFVVTVVNIWVLYELVSGVESQAGSVILVYACGNAVGTFIVIKRHEFRKVYALFRQRG